MPKAPILYRQLFYARNNDGTFRDLDFALVNTSLGAMAEPRCVCLDDGDVKAGLDQLDVLDMSWNKRSEKDEATMLTDLGTYGLMLPVDYNNPLV